MRHTGLVLGMVLALSASAFAGGYELPSAEITEAVRSPVPPVVYPNGDQSRVLVVQHRRFLKVADLATPVVRTAGLRIDPASHNMHLATFSIGTDWVNLSIKNLVTGENVPVALPPGRRITRPLWSPDGKRFAFANRTENGTELWIGDARTGALKRIDSVKVNEVFAAPLTEEALAWYADSRNLLVRAVPENIGTPPASSIVPEEPIVQDSSGRRENLVTYPDLVRSRADETLLDYYATSILTVVDVETGEKRTVGKPAIFTQSRPSPDGSHILISRLTRPYSYVYPWNLFPRKVELLNRSGDVAFTVASFGEGATAGPKAAAWHPIRGATLIWNDSAAGKNRIVALRAPFQASPVALFHSDYGIQASYWGEDNRTLLVTVRRADWKRDTAFQIDTSASGGAPRQLWSFNVEDRYSDPGVPVQRTLENGFRAMRVLGSTILLSGEGLSPVGSRPFVDRYDLATGASERIFKSEVDAYERVQSISASASFMAITRRESVKQSPVYLLRDLSNLAQSPSEIAGYVAGSPLLERIDSRLINYRRSDGVDLSSMLYLPAGYVSGTKVPVIVWAYPTEYLSHDFAGQAVSSSARYMTSLYSNSQLYIQFYLLAGYAVVDAAMPIIGQPSTVNDTLIAQMTENSRSLIDELVRIGVSDGKQLGVTGHSYGAFMTAHLLAHTDLFKAGVARSGAYNRTLTPFGFQNEPRNFWQAPEFYLQVSPFTAADKINEPLLLMHGQDDNNSGTFPIQSERLFAAIRGNGGTARYVQLPLENHWYMTEESNLHTMAESVRWFDKYVKAGWDPGGLLRMLGLR